MSHPKRGLKALGLSLLAALGLMAFMAAGAQANWLILHNGGTSEAKATVSAKAHTEGNLKVEDSFKTEILCSTIAAQELSLGEKSTLAAGKVAFSGCKTWQSGKAQPNCNPAEPITAGGTAHLTLHNSKNYVVFKPSGASFAVVEFGELCALGEEVAVTGSLAAECGWLTGGAFAGLDCNVHQVEGLLRPVVPQSLLSTGLKFGANTASLTGSAGVRLTELFNGDAFGGHV
jgi:hypothetical protein